MEIKLFGKSLFSIKTGKAEVLVQQATTEMKESKFLPDFHSLSSQESPFIAISDAVMMSNPELSVLTQKVNKDGVSQKTKEKQLTPKEVYQLKMLHDEGFVLKADPAYIDNQLADFKDKLGLIKNEEYDMRRGVTEISSLIQRLENRKKYGEVKDIFDEFPYTTTSRINELVEAHAHLKLGQIAQFVADLPKEATETMKKYNSGVKKICGKLAVFYIIADKKDFQQTQKRRDPILLAQSPFGHFWQILGAWDKEVLFLEEL